MLPLFPLALLFAGFQPRARIYGIIMCPETTTTMVMLAQLHCRSRNRMPTVKSKILTIFTDCFWGVAFSWISFNFLKNSFYHLQFLSFVLLFFARFIHIQQNNISLRTTRKNSLMHQPSLPLCICLWSFLKLLLIFLYLLLMPGPQIAVQGNIMFPF